MMADKESPGRIREKKKSCPQCNTVFLCMHDATCWCMDYTLTAEALAYLRQTFDDCLCPACLSRHGIPKNDPAGEQARN